ncbi:transcriptional regulator [Metallosphaera hakonensis]|uniref:Transcriptional regulator n=1 Tax=Metallosphaera hakonensis JCM 8857 = DSM 7519 TaxID=1293036 RepID=A0A2U9ISP8_9CREN|nr:transcriptional regulator [Metallosphaera hakonensis]AWR99045.1 transcriptional regulator [Metallosphaera hakonensis JCM 8857 = DSM 7519]
MKISLRINNQSPGDKCENCGRPLTPETTYVRQINGQAHYFCCSHCADAFEKEQHCC